MRPHLHRKLQKWIIVMGTLRMARPAWTGPLLSNQHLCLAGPLTMLLDVTPPGTIFTQGGCKWVMDSIQPSDIPAPSNLLSLDLPVMVSTKSNRLSEQVVGYEHQYQATDQLEGYPATSSRKDASRERLRHGRGVDVLCRKCPSRRKSVRGGRWPPGKS